MNVDNLDNSIKSESIDNIKEENICNYEKKDLNEILASISKIELQKLDILYKEKDNENKGKRYCFILI